MKYLSKEDFDRWRKEYYKSEKFKKLKKKCWKRDEHCQWCPKRNLPCHVHHETYRNFGKGDDSELTDCVLICEACHEKYHDVNSIRDLERHFNEYYNRNMQETKEQSEPMDEAMEQKIKEGYEEWRTYWDSKKLDEQ